jgi:hypothetical protein
MSITRYITQLRRGYYETARYDVFGYWWITGYFWNGLEFTS